MRCSFHLLTITRERCQGVHSRHAGSVKESGFSARFRNQTVRLEIFLIQTLGIRYVNEYKEILIVMSLFRRKTQSEIDSESLNRLLDECRERVRVLQQVSGSLIFFLREFAMDIAEIETDGFKNRLDQIAENFQQERTVYDLKDAFSDHKLFILNFIGRQKDHLREKEAELMNIIELLRNGMTAMIGDTQDFNAKIYDQNVRMEAITQLDDIRKIKESLKTEVHQMKQIIQEKQASDSRRIESLSKEVTVLRSSLEKVKDASMVDAMTGAYNRMTFDARMQWVVQRSEIVWNPTSLMMCDLDNFKLINDTYGHIMGDRVLKCFVQECKTMFRSDDFVARYGGEEFAVLLPGINLRKALKRARSFCKLLAAKQFLIDPSQPDERIRFTVSIGVSELRKGDSGDAFVDRADKALYQAKRTGKSRAVSEKEVR
jgi:diguanylate cyclase